MLLLILAIYLFSAGMFLVMFLICAVVKEKNKLIELDMWRVFRFALTPVVNTFFAFGCLMLLIMTGVEKVVFLVRFIKVEIQLFAFDWELKRKIDKGVKEDEWFNQVKNDLQKRKKN